MTTDYYALLVQLVRKEPSGNKGEVWITCVECGKGGKHYSFSPRGSHCVKCGAKPSLRKLYETLAGTWRPDEIETPHIPPAKPKPWQARANQLADKFHNATGLVAHWHKYKPVPEYLIRRNKLGYGVFPDLWNPKTKSTCKHPRLIVPLFDEDKVVGFRCRAVECDCHKWLSPTGSVLTLYNSQYLTTGKPVMIVENPADALLVEGRGMSAAATLGVSIWKDGYYAKVRDASFRWVGFDNDRTGREAGQKLVRKLNQAKLSARSYSWKGYPAGCDIGQVLSMQICRQHA